MWINKTDNIDNKTIRYQILEHDRILSFKDILQLWASNSKFRNHYIQLLQQVPFEGYFWETPPINIDTIQQPFEFVIIESKQFPHLEANRRAFAQFFKEESEFEGIISFMNLGKDARLVVPKPLDGATDYTHLGAFMQLAPIEQIHEFWRCIGSEMQSHLNTRNTWLSTAGMGVYWLHVRMDSRPKYYRYIPYKNGFSQKEKEKLF